MQENEKRENGSCWDQGPTLRVAAGECPPIRPLCELPAGHLGAHREGRIQWMQRKPVGNATINQILDTLREIREAEIKCCECSQTVSLLNQLISQLEQECKIT